MCLLCAKHCARGFRVCEFTWQALYGTNRKEYISLHITCCWSSSSYGSRRTQCVCAQSCLTLCNPMDCSFPGFSAHGISQVSILEWVAISSSRGSSWPRNWTHISCVSCTSRLVLYHWATWEAPLCADIEIISSFSWVRVWAVESEHLYLWGGECCATWHVGY